MEMEQLKKALRAQIEEYKTLAFELSDQMAREPEIGSQEYKSSAAIVKLLRDHGVEVEYPFAGYRTAFRGQICPERKVRMALLAEYDALRGLGHACGHCASGSGSVLAALAFQAFRDEYLFGVDIIGTPDEEYIGTKIGMAEKGIFDGYDFVAMVHMGPQTTAEVQFIALDGIGVLDGYAAKLSCARLDEQDLSNLAFYIEAMDIAIKAGNYFMYDKHQVIFHQLYIDKCGNSVLIDTIEKTKNKLLKRTYLDDPEGNLKKILLSTNDEHRQILALFRAKDADALAAYLADVHWRPAYAPYDVIL